MKMDTGAVLQEVQLGMLEERAWGVQWTPSMRHGQPGSCCRCGWAKGITADLSRVVGYSPIAPPRGGDRVADGNFVEICSCDSYFWYHVSIVEIKAGKHLCPHWPKS